ncbi:MAG: polysaccharide biosynthesis C-terminal domain-containing protein [Elusimicrobia bacterium]|nr:polysaccharide biosynthesis C-terminal domain-containing protein [Elusimicrobiota bacterium]
MMGEIKKLGGESVIYGLSTVVARLLNFILVPFYTYFLLPSEYGIVAAVFSYIAFLNAIYQFGMDQAYMRFAGETSDDKKAFSTAMFCVAGISAAVSATLMLGSQQAARLCGIGAENSGLIFYSAVILTLDALSSAAFAKLRLMHKAWNFVAVKTAGIVLNVACNIIFVGFMGMKVEGVFLASLLASAFSLALLWPVFRASLRWIFDGELFSEMVKFAWPFVPAGLGAMIVQVIDRPILLFLTDAKTVGIYQANYRLGIFMMLFVSMFDQAWRPFFLERANTPNAPNIFARVFTYFALAGVFFAAGISFFIGDVIKTSVFGFHLLNENYWGGLSIVPIILFGYLFYGFYINFMASAAISKRTSAIMKVTFLGAATNVLANFLLIPNFNMTGAAWATFISYFIMAGAMYFYGKKLYPVPYEYKRAGKVFLAAAITLGLWLGCGKLFGENPPAFLLCKLAIIALYPVELFLLGFFTDGEKRRIGEMI